MDVVAKRCYGPIGWTRLCGMCHRENEALFSLGRYESLLFQSPEATITELSLCHITGMREMLRKFSSKSVFLSYLQGFP